MDYEQLTVGTRIAEFDLGTSIESVIIEQPIKKDDGNYVQWSWKSKTDDGCIIDYLRTVGFESYCGRLQILNCE